MKELVSQPVRGTHLLNIHKHSWMFKRTLSWLFASPTWKCAFRNNIQELASVSGNLTLQGQARVSRTPAVFGDTDHYKISSCLLIDATPARFTRLKAAKVPGDITVSFDLFTEEQVRQKGYCPLKNIPAALFFILMLPFCLFGEKVCLSAMMSPKMRLQRT